VHERSRRAGVAGARMIAVAIAQLAIGDVFAVGNVAVDAARRDQETRREHGSNAARRRSAVGVAGRFRWNGIGVARRDRGRGRDAKAHLARLCVAVFPMTDDPLGMLGAGLAPQLTGFAVLVFLR
jgi:hypothetical protein